MAKRIFQLMLRPWPSLPYGWNFSHREEYLGIIALENKFDQKGRANDAIASVRAKQTKQKISY